MTSRAHLIRSRSYLEAHRERTALLHHDGASGYDARVRDAPDVGRAIDQLVNGWCDRRCLAALRWILRGWPITSPLTDSWCVLLDALEKVRAHARDALTEDERARVED